jgi:hypothetical protein
MKGTAADNAAALMPITPPDAAKEPANAVAIPADTVPPIWIFCFAFDCARL